MMLERVNYLISTEVQLPVPEMSDKIADIMFAAFGLAIALRGQGGGEGRRPAIGSFRRCLR